MLRLLLFTGLWCVSGMLLPSAMAQDDGQIAEVLILVGPSNHPPGSHEVAAGGRVMEHCINHIKNVEGIRARVFYEWPKNESVLDQAATIVFIGDMFPPNRMPASERILAKLGTMMNRGCGIVCVHYATGLQGDQVGANGEHPLLHWLGGYAAFRCPHHQSRARIYPAARIVPAAPKHPLARGWSEFTIHDEPYTNNYFGSGDPNRHPNVIPLATSLLPPEAPKKETVAWCLQREDGGRGFGIVMPHFYSNWKNDDLRTLIMNGIVWSAQKPVPKSGVQTQLSELANFKPESVEPQPRKKP